MTEKTYLRDCVCNDTPSTIPQRRRLKEDRMFYMKALYILSTYTSDVYHIISNTKTLLDINTSYI